MVIWGMVYYCFTHIIARYIQLFFVSHPFTKWDAPPSMDYSVINQVRIGNPQNSTGI